MKCTYLTLKRKLFKGIFKELAMVLALNSEFTCSAASMEGEL